MLGEDVKKEQLCQSRGINGVMHGDEYALLREVIHNDEDGCESGQRRKMFNEIKAVHESESLQVTCKNHPWETSPSQTQTCLPWVILMSHLQRLGLMDSLE